MEVKDQQLSETRTSEGDRLRQDAEGLQAEVDVLKRDLAAAQRLAAEIGAELAALQLANGATANVHAELSREHATLQQAHTELQQVHDEASRDLAALQQTHEALCDTYSQQTQGYDELLQNHEQALAAKQVVEESLASLEQQHIVLQKEYEQAVAARQQAEQGLAALGTVHDEFVASHSSQAQAFDELRQTHAQALAAQQQIEIALADLEKSHAELLARHAGQVQSCEELRQESKQALEAQQLAERAVTDRETAAAAIETEIQELRSERQSLVERLAEAESNVATTNLQRNDELHRRFELAVEDVRSLKRRNSELEEQLMGLKAAAAARPATLAAAGSDSPGWEAMKKQMIESLEADTDSSESRAEERLTIENTIVITDDVVAHKDREIAELKLVLSQQSNTIGSVAIGAAAAVAALDDDAVIRQEREKLAQLQEEWKRKLRQAEIDISVERAKITRDRAEIEDKLAAFEKERAQQGRDSESTNGESTTAPEETDSRPLARTVRTQGWRRLTPQKPDA